MRNISKLAMFAAFSASALAQSAQQAVVYLYPEQVTVAAGKPATIHMHFRIGDGLHINSHAPREEDLVPTALSFPADAGVKLESAEYPEGKDYVLPADPSTRLNVYTGEISIEARIVAAPGDHLVEARLRYQACDQVMCMPPKTIPVVLDVLGK